MSEQAQPTGTLPSETPAESLAHYLALLAAADAVVLTLDAGGYIVAACASLESLLGYVPDDYVGKPLTDLMPQGWQAHFSANAMTDAATTEYPLLTHNGDWRWMRHTALTGDDGYTRCLLQDITDERQRQQTLHLKQQAVEASLTGVMIADAQADDLPLIYINPAFERITGYSQAELIGRNCRFLQGDDTDQRGLDTLRDAIETGDECVVLLRNYRADGTLFWNKLALSPIFNADGTLTHYVGFSNDVTAQKTAEQSLAQERNLLRTILDNIPDLIHAKDADGTYILSNAAHAAGIGAAAPHEVVGKTGSDILPADLAEQFRAEDEAVMTGEIRVHNEERQLYHAADDQRHFSASKLPLITDDGDVIGVVGIARDITERKRTEAELERREELYRTLARNLPQSAVFLYDRNYNLLVAEGQALDPQLYPREQLEGSRIHDVLETYLDDPTQLTDAYESVFAGEETYFEEAYGDVYYSIRAIPVRNDAGEIFAGIVLAQNIDEQKRRAEALRQSEERNRALLNALPDMMFVLSRDGVYTEFHSSNERALFGEAFDNMIGRNIREVGMSDELVEDALLYMERAFQTGRTQTFEYVMTMQGMDYYLEARMVAISDDEVLALVRDISDLKLIQDELGSHIEDLTLLRQIDSELSDSLNVNFVTQLALDSLLRLSNAQAGYIAVRGDDGQLAPAALVGEYDPHELVEVINGETGIIPRAMQRQTDDFVMDVHAEPAYTPLLDDTTTMIVMPLIAQEHPVGVIVLEAKTPERFSFERFQFLRLVTGRVASVLENARLHQQTEDQLLEMQQLYDDVRRLEQLKTDMIRIASHDLKNPLAGIMGNMQMLRWEDSFTDDAMEYMDRINQAANRMQGMISGILSLERIEEMAQQQSRERVNLAHLFRDTASEYSAEAAEKQQTIVQQIPDERVPVLGDPIQLHEAIANLIGNAIKYTPDGGTITLSLEMRGTFSELRVQDTGYGIPKALQKRLFTPFFRAKTDETDGIDGTGLGLHLVKNIVERHGGEMYLHSVYGEGSIFGFDLPLPPGYDPDDDSDDDDDDDGGFEVTGSTVIG